jgi:hypothetical protein
MEPNIFLGYLERGVLSCGPMRVLHSFKVLVGLCNTLQFVEGYDMELKPLHAYVAHGITRSLNMLFYELEYNVHSMCIN